MKGKQSKPRHKETNRFRFQCFSDRISDIKIDVYHRIKHVNEEESESQTYFSQALEKWSLLNCSVCFVDLQKEIKDVLTLPQILKKKDHVVSVLLKHLDAKNVLNLQPVLELIVALAKDIRQDFYSYYPDFHPRLLSILEIHDPDVLEWTFHCIAYLFKFLWRYLVTDLQNIFESLMPLLSSSKPYYINNFAAESFAFVARKVKDRKKFLYLTLKVLKKFPDGVEGCGRLLFEVVKGVMERFHSCAETTLPVYLEFAEESGISFDVFCEVITSAFTDIISYIHPDHCSLLWTTLKNELVRVTSGAKSDNYIQTVNFILNIIKMAVENRSGALVKDPDSLTAVLIKIILPSAGQDTSSINSSSEILSLLLLSHRVNLTQELASKIVVSAMSYLKEESLLLFMENVLNYTGFDGLILPRLLKYCNNNPVDVTLRIMTKVVLLHSPPIGSAHQIINHQPYQLAFSKERLNGSKSYDELLLEELASRCPGALVSDIDKITSCLLILPCTNVDRTKFLSVLKNVMNSLCSYLTKDCSECCDQCSVSPTNCLLIQKATVILSIAIEACIKFKADCPSKLCEPNIFLPAVVKFCQSEEYLSALRALDLYITSDELNSVADFTADIKDKIWINLMSPYHKMRLYSGHILYELEKGCETSNNLSLQIYESCWYTELSPATVTEYREKLKYIHKIEVDCSLSKNSGDEANIKSSIALLLGQLFINFKLIWSPVSKVLASVSQSCSSDTFWHLFYSQLSRISFLIRQRSSPYKLEQIYSSDYLSSVYDELNDFDDRVDYINYRIILWEAMKEFSDLCEMKNHDVVQEFLTFVQEEYFTRNSDLANTWNIKHISNVESKIDTTIDNDLSINVTSDLDESDVMITDEVTETDNAESNENKITESESENGGDKCNEDEGANSTLNDQSANVENDDEPEEEPETVFYKWSTKSLLVHLELMAKFKAPKSISRHQELHKYYLEFLSHRKTDVQKAALNCLLSFKEQYLLPYRQHLYNLTDDNTFRFEINMFRIDSDSDVIKSDHRIHLIPIVLRIVYMKMFTGSNKGKNSKFARRAAVIRFLGGCTPEELNSYFDMVFLDFMPFVQDDAVKMVEEIMSGIDVERTVPPRRLQSLVGLLQILVVNTGGLLDHKSLGRVMRLVLCHAACSVGCLAQRHLVHSTYVKTLKNIRSTSFDIFIWFFDKFQSYPWTPNEIDAIFSVLVWSWIEKFHSDSAKAPTPLLRLFSAWSQNPRYFILLGHSKELNGKQYSPLSALMDLWLVKTVKSVYNIITDIVERLLTLIPPQESEVPLRISQSPFLNVSSFPEKAFSSLNFGSKLMLYHANSVMEKLKQKLSEGSNIGGKELEIISRITELIMLMENSEENYHKKDSSLCESLFSLLLPILLKKISAEEHVTIPLLTSIKNLIALIPSPGKHIRSLAPLFSKVSGPVPTKLLTSVIINAYERGGSEFDLNCEVVEDLNSFNIKWLDQPDFDRRLSCFKKIETLMKEDKISFNLGLIIINTCYNFLCTEKDLSLRDNASHCLRLICPYLSKHFQKNDPNLCHLLVDKTILNIICAGIKKKDADFVRNECIVLLGVMIRECPETHQVLEDLTIFTNKENLDIDFFENMQHLQLHRRIRALLKFGEAIKSYEKLPKPRAMTQFILPIISHYLCNEKYIGQPTVIDGAIQALAAVCRLLPHHQYLSVLKYYLEQLQMKDTFQKQLARINIKILNAFHFDLSSAEGEVVVSLKDNKSKKSEVDSTKTEDHEEDDTKNANDDEEEEMEDSFLVHDEEVADEETIENNEKMETDSPVVAFNIMEHVSVLCRSAAVRVIAIIKEQLITKLENALGQRTPNDSCHRTNRRQSLEDTDLQDIVRIPLAIAIVKLLQKLPANFLDSHLSGILMKVISYLKSRVETVRQMARKTLEEIAISLGPRHLCTIVKEMTPLLTRGFHVHVLAFTVHSILASLKPHFKQGDIDAAIPHILEVCRMDLFGDCSEEKEVAQILSKVVEARSSKSFSSFNIMSQYVSEKYLLTLVIPLKEELSQTLSAKTVSKVSGCLKQIVLGLVENQFLSVESLVLFAYGSSSESIPSLLPQEVAKVDPKVKEWQSRRPKDCFIIPAEPKRKKCAEMKACSLANSYLLVEFGLRLLHALLKRNKLKDPAYLPLLDPFVKLLSDCLKSQHVKVSTMATQCLSWILMYDLPSLKDHIKDLTDSFFSILHKYASSGLSKGDNFELVFGTFKAMGVLVKEVNYTELSQDQMRVLLMYCEQDIEDHTRQTTAFSLLKAVIAGKVKSPELPAIMDKVAAISVTAPLDNARTQARQVVHHYLMEYPLGKSLNSYLSFYYNNLGYDQQSGRESILLMFQTIVETFPLIKLEEESSVMFIHLAAHLINEPSPECRRKVAAIMSAILSKIGNNTKNKLFEITGVWLQQDKESTRRLAAQVVGLFISFEKEDFSPRIDGILPLLVDQFLSNNNKPGRFVLLNQTKDTETEDEDGEEDRKEESEECTNGTGSEIVRDHLLFQVLQVLGKILTHIPTALTKEEYRNHWSCIFGHAHSLLCHGHEWVRLGAVQLIGLMLSGVSPQDLAYSISHPPDEDDSGTPGVQYLFSTDPRATVRSITLDLLAQLTPDNQLNDKFILQIMKLLVYIAEVLKELVPKQNNEIEDEMEDEKEKTLSLPWLVRKVRRVINGEIVHAPNSTSVRTMCFNWMAAVAVKLDRSTIANIGYHLVAPLARELTLGDESNNLTQVARDASQYIKGKLGHNEYNRLLTIATTKMDVKKAHRKTERVQMVINDPVRAAKRKLHMKEKKKLLKKRKFESFKTNKYIPKARKEVKFQEF